MSLRSQAGAPNHESRPLPRDNKKFGILKRYAASGIGFRNRHTQSLSSSSRNQQQIDIHTYSNSAPSVVTSSSCNSLDGLSTNSSNTTDVSMKTDNNQKPDSSTVITKTGTSIRSMDAFSSGFNSKSGGLNIMHWMQNDCPRDVVLLVLAFAGPQKISKIGRTNHFWHQLVSQESTWRHFCESFYKWREGDDIPSSWKKYYQYNPCVPIDYYDIHTALNEAIGNAKQDSSKPRGVRVLLRPGSYIVQKAITIDDTMPNNHSLSVAIETMAYSPGNYYKSDYIHNFTALHQSPDRTKKKTRKFN